MPKPEAYSNYPVTRTEALKTGAYFAVHLLFPSVPKPPTPEAPTLPFEPKSTTPAQIEAIRGLSISEAQKQQLIDHLTSVEEKKLAIMKIVWEKNLMVGNRSKDRLEIQEDLDRYAALYMKVGEKYKIPFSLLWVIHTDETENSINPRPDHGNLGGPTQINRSDFKRWNLGNAIEGYEAFKALPTLRYKGKEMDPKSPSLYNDASEMFATGMYIQKFSDKNNNSNIKDADSEFIKNMKSQIIYLGPRSIYGSYGSRKQKVEKIHAAIGAIA